MDLLLLCFQVSLSVCPCEFYFLTMFFVVNRQPAKASYYPYKRDSRCESVMSTNGIAVNDKLLHGESHIGLSSLSKPIAMSKRLFNYSFPYYFAHIFPGFNFNENSISR